MGTEHKYPSSISSNMGTEHNYSCLNYRILRRNRKTIGIKITDKGEIVVISPFNISEETIRNIVKQKESWILSKIEWIRQKCLVSVDKSFKTGELFLYLGRKISLEVLDNNSDRCRAVVWNDKLVVYAKKGEEKDVIKDAVVRFYREEAIRVLSERTTFYSGIISVRPQRITIKDQKTVWGSCSSKKNINYNYRLIMAPIDIIDYVVVHELCHLVHMNHSKEYWQTVEAILPDYKKRRQWLKDNGFMLKI